MASRDLPETRRGYDVREVVSALQKAIRRSDPDAALYWAHELDRSGFGPWCWKRLRVICSEDIGPSAPGLASDVRALYENWLDGRKNKGGEEVLYLSHAVIALATAHKSRVVDWAVLRHTSDYVERREVPDEALDKHTLRGRRMGRGIEHFMDEASRLEQWVRSLEALEEDYLDKARRLIAEEPGVPLNPWGTPGRGTPQPAQNYDPGPSGQLPLDREETT
jgi:replication-associated recombination protein RarA